MAQGTLFIISAPSGAGKTSLVSEILMRMDNIQASISHTTRAARTGEVDGVNYHFVSQQVFQSMVTENAFLEHAQVFGNFYGTSKQWVQDTLNAGIDVILEIDWQGAEQVRQQFVQSKSIFILPPSKQALADRLNERGQDDVEVINKRVAAATEEMSHYIEADYLVINDNFDLALEQLKSIISAQRCKMPVQGHEKLLSDLLS
ncbi:MAG: guanylate kinase [Porticoccaceae bacterium]